MDRCRIDYIVPIPFYLLKLPGELDVQIPEDGVELFRYLGPLNDLLVGRVRDPNEESWTP